MEEIQLDCISSANKGCKPFMPNVLLISGDQRKVGKTTLGCRLINELISKEKVIAIKISPHFHPLGDSMEITKVTPSLIIGRETEDNSGKDSSRYLEAGAFISYYVQVKEEGLEELSEWIQANISYETPVICESGSLNEIITPGYSIYIKRGFGEDCSLPQKEILYNNNEPERVKSKICWRNNKWAQ